MPRYRLPSDDPWFYATWEGARLRSLIEAASWTMIEKLAWLEEITELADRMRPVPERPAEPMPLSPRVSA